MLFTIFSLEVSKWKSEKLLAILGFWLHYMKVLRVVLVCHSEACVISNFLTGRFQMKNEKAFGTCFLLRLFSGLLLWTCIYNSSENCSELPCGPWKTPFQIFSLFLGKKVSNPDFAGNSMTKLKNKCIPLVLKNSVYVDFQNSWWWKVSQRSFANSLNTSMNLRLSEIWIYFSLFVNNGQPWVWT